MALLYEGRRNEQPTNANGQSQTKINIPTNQMDTPIVTKGSDNPNQANCIQQN
jgi:hypothetical protein